MNRVLVVDDEPAMRAALEASFSHNGWKVETASGTHEAVERFRSWPCPLVITDMRMPDGDGLKVMSSIRTLAPETAIIFLTAYGSVPEAVKAMKGGACDYLVKPISFEQLHEAARRVLKIDSSRAKGQETENGIVGDSVPMRRLIERARHIAKTDVDMLLEAESGTGKELFARMIHESSRRRSGPFVAVNCAAFPDTLLESELFGYMKGAFTGATNSHMGKFELANRGTILLDEVSEMPLQLQPKLLRVLQQREVDRLGDRSPISIDVRVIATTNRDLSLAVKEGKFRADLYYRLNVVALNIPPLRERKDDIPALIDHFIRKYSTADSPVEFSPEIMACMLAHDWPGNIRELENIVRRILALAIGPIADIDLLEGTNLTKLEAAPVPMELGASLQEMERQMYLRALEETHGNRTHAAELLGVSVRTVRNKVREFGIPARRNV
ncbi:MAG: sigma-54-dependent transcriptional regulator [Terriglobia bacterium]